MYLLQHWSDLSGRPGEVVYYRDNPLHSPPHPCELASRQCLHDLSDEGMRSHSMSIKVLSSTLIVLITILSATELHCWQLLSFQCHYDRMTA